MATAWLQGLVGSAADGRAVRADSEGRVDAHERLGREVAENVAGAGRARADRRQLIPASRRVQNA